MLQLFDKRRKRIFLMYVLSRITFLCIIYVSGSSIKEICTLWDNEHYVSIAQNGYVLEWQTAFFPVIPLLIRLIGQTGVIILNQVVLLATMFLLDELSDKKNYYVTDLFIMLPVSFFSLTLYTETLLCFLTLLAYYLFVKRRFGYTLGIIIGLGVATKSIGAMLFFAVFIGMCYLWYKRQLSMSDIIKTYAPATLLSCMYPVYLQIVAGNWKLFIDCQYEYWNRIKTNPIEELMIQLRLIFYKGTDLHFVYRLNEVVTLIVVCFMLFEIYACLRTCRHGECNRVNAMVMVMYMVFSMYAINASIRIPFEHAPTTSFYRYYYSLFPMYILTTFFKEREKDIFFIGSLVITLLATVLYSIGYFFY